MVASSSYRQRPVVAARHVGHHHRLALRLVDGALVLLLVAANFQHAVGSLIEQLDQLFVDRVDLGAQFVQIYFHGVISLRVPLLSVLLYPGILLGLQALVNPADVAAPVLVLAHPDSGGRRDVGFAACQ